jgi:hypothetical protein
MSAARLDLYWIPLGAGASVVRLSGHAYEALAAWWQRREPCPLFHSALVATVDGTEIVIEMTPVPDDRGVELRGVVAEGPVGSRWLGGLRVFRYEVRRWTGGSIPDLAAAVESPVCLTTDGDVVQRVLSAVAELPTPVWGRDELGTGDMWNSNSIVAWTLATAGLDLGPLSPPGGGRAPGWHAGLEVAQWPDPSRHPQIKTFTA